MSRPEVLAAPESKEVNVPTAISIEVDTDIVAARQLGRKLAVAFGFSSSDATIAATAISELARNILLYAQPGNVTLDAVMHDDWSALIITAHYQGMGIADLSPAMRDGYPTSACLGIGLPAVERLLDEFDVVSEVGQGTVLTVTKWQRGAAGAQRTCVR